MEEHYIDHTFLFSHHYMKQIEGGQEWTGIPFYFAELSWGIGQGYDYNQHLGKTIRLTGLQLTNHLGSYHQSYYNYAGLTRRLMILYDTTHYTAQLDDYDTSRMSALFELPVDPLPDPETGLLYSTELDSTLGCVWRNTKPQHSTPYRILYDTTRAVTKWAENDIIDISIPLNLPLSFSDDAESEPHYWNIKYGTLWALAIYVPSDHTFVDTHGLYSYWASTWIRSRLYFENI